MSLIGAIKILDDRRIASRERNKMHARKTRQRKKEHMTQLENRVQSLKQHQTNIKLLIKEKNTANILLGMFANSGSVTESQNAVDPKVDCLLKRKAEDIPDSSKIPDLPALILPGHHNKRRKLEVGSSGSNAKQEYPNDGIDYELLGKDRTSCTTEELDKIRKERNRMHAKRTRDRKRIFMEEMEKIIKQLEGENELLERHLSDITSNSNNSSSSSSAGRVTPALNSPTQIPCTPTVKPTDASLTSQQAATQQTTTANTNTALNGNAAMCNAKPDFSLSSTISTISMSPTPYQQNQLQVAAGSCSQELSENTRSHHLPSSITTSASSGTQLIAE